jgi:cytidine deaminase
MKRINYKDLPKDYKVLLKKAEKAMERAYNPYSGFSVGAALLTKEGKIITGANVENAAYGSSICAERSAIMRANAMGYRIFTAIAIIAKGKNFDTTEITAPCGECRQVLNEFSQISEYDFDIILSTSKKDKIEIWKISELLPKAFGPKDLRIDVKRYQE